MEKEKSSLQEGNKPWDATVEGEKYTKIFSEGMFHCSGEKYQTMDNEIRFLINI